MSMDEMWQDEESLLFQRHSPLITSWWAERRKLILAAYWKITSTSSTNDWNFVDQVQKKIETNHYVEQWDEAQHRRCSGCEGCHDSQKMRNELFSSRNEASNSNHHYSPDVFTWMRESTSSDSSTNPTFSWTAERNERLPVFFFGLELASNSKLQWKLKRIERELRKNRERIQEKRENLDQTNRRKNGTQRNSSGNEKELIEKWKRMYGSGLFRNDVNKLSLCFSMGNWRTAVTESFVVWDCLRSATRAGRPFLSGWTCFWSCCFLVVCFQIPEMAKSRFQKNFDDANSITLLPETMFSFGLVNSIKAFSSYERMPPHIVLLSLLSATSVLIEHSHAVQDEKFPLPTNLFTIIPSFSCEYFASLSLAAHRLVSDW